MSSKLAKDREPMSYQALLDENSDLKDELQSLRTRLEEAEELKRTIREGDLDALVIPGPEGELIFTLDSADRAYRVLVETMNEGTATLASDGTILYCNHHFAELLKMPLQAIIGTSIYRFIAPENAITFKALLKQEVDRGELNFQAGEGISLPVYLSVSSLKSEGSPNAWCLVVTDLTEQKKNEEIVAAERLTRSIIEQTAEAIVVCDTSGKITHFSNDVSRICRCDPTFQIFEDLIDVQFSEGKDAGKSILPISSALKGFSIRGVEATFELKDCNNFHQKFHLHLNSGPLKNSNGKVIGCVVTLADITERKQLEEQTQQRAEKLETVMETAPVAIWIGHDPQSHNITGNRMANEFYEAEVGENVSANVTPVRRFFYKGRELTADELPMQQASLEDIDVHSVELDVLLPSGERRALPGSASPLHDPCGHVRGSVGACIDITEHEKIEEALRQSEQHYRLLHETMLQGVVYQDADGKIISMNPAAERILGKTPAEFLGSSSVGEDYHTVREDGSPFPGLEHPAMVSLRTGRKVQDVVMGVYNPREKCYRWININAVPIFRPGEDRPFQVYTLFNEITEQKQAVEALRKSEERYRTLFNTMEEGFCIIEMLFDENEKPIDYIFVETNPAFGKNTGFKNAVGKRIRELVPENEEYWYEMYGKVALTGESVRFENRSEALHRWYEVYAFSIGQPKSRKVAILFNDITKHKRTEEKLREAYEKIKTQSEELQTSNEELKTQSEELKEANEALYESEKRFRTLAENSPDIIARIDRQKRHIYVNPAVAGPYGRSPEEIIGKTQSELGKYSEQLKFLEKHYENVLATGKPETIEFQYISSQGKEYYLNTKIVPEFVDGKVTSVLAISRDITDIKKTEAKLRETLDNLENLVKERTSELEKAYKLLKESERSLAEAQKMARLGNWDLNFATHEMYWSDEIYRIFGHKPQEFNATYDSFLSYIHPDDRDYVSRAIKKALNGTSCSFDYRIISASGEEHIVHAQKAVIFNEENIPVRITGTIQDITESKREEHKICRYNNVLEGINRIFGSVVRAETEELANSCLSVALEVTGGGIGFVGIVDTEGLLNDIVISEMGWDQCLMYDKTGHRLPPGDFILHGLYGVLIDTGKSLFTNDLRSHPDRIGLPQGHPPLTSFLGVPLILDGKVMGMLAVANREGGYSYEQQEDLEKIAPAVTQVLQRKKAEEALEKIEKIRIKEIHHRIKNNLQVISSLLSLEADRFTDEKILEALRESQNRVTSMALIHEELYKGGKNDAVDFAAYLHKLTADLLSSYHLGNDNVSLKMDLEQIYLDMDTAIPLGIIVNELISNALKHAFPAGSEGEININLCKTESFAAKYDISGPDPDCMEKDGFHYILTVKDDGKGIPEKIEFQNADSLGLQLVNILVEQIDGDIELRRDQGTKFTIWFNSI